MDITERAENLSKQFNRITDRLKDNLDISDDLTVSGDELLECVKEKTNIPLSELADMDEMEVVDILNLQNLVNDFSYIRSVLKENTEDGRKILNTLSSALLDVDMSESPALIASFAELNRTLTENMKLFVQSYKEISTIIINLNKAKTIVEPQHKITNNLNINNITSVENDEQAKNVIISSADLIKQLKSS